MKNKLLLAAVLALVTVLPARAEWQSTKITNLLSGSAFIVTNATQLVPAQTNYTGNVVPLPPDLNGVALTATGTAAGATAGGTVTTFIGLSADGTNFPTRSNSLFFTFQLNSNGVATGSTNISASQLLGYKALRVVGFATTQTNLVTMSNIYGHYHKNPLLQNR